MKVFLLKMNAGLHQIERVEPDLSNFCYILKLQCDFCSSVNNEEIKIQSNSPPYMSPHSPVPGHAFPECICKVKGRVTIISGHGCPFTREDSDLKKFVPLLKVECVNFVPIEFAFKGFWIATKVTGEKVQVNMNEDGYTGDEFQVSGLNYIFEEEEKQPTPSEVFTASPYWKKMQQYCLDDAA